MQISRFQDFLGKLIEKYPSFFLKLGCFETQWVEDAISSIEINRPVYVTGLARSGSTILLEFLAAHSDVASHQYRDFPLVCVPVWWNWFLDRATSGNQGAATERAHKDRIKVSPKSPEAMEELLWMTFFPGNHDPSKNNILGNQEINPNFETFYRNHIRKILFIRKGSRYLAKGNYNISRLGYINKLFPDARFIVPVRDPVSHIASLMRQHKLFSDAETSDIRVLSHMQRSGHFEFGLDRRPINFGYHDTTHRIEKLWSEGQEIKGWALYWTSVYSYIADLLEKNERLARQMLVVNYNNFCEQPAAMLQRIYNHCELKVNDSVLQNQASHISTPTYYTSDFSQSDIKIINKETRDTEERIQKLLLGK